MSIIQYRAGFLADFLGFSLGCVSHGQRTSIQRVAKLHRCRAALFGFRPRQAIRRARRPVGLLSKMLVCGKSLASGNAPCTVFVVENVEDFVGRVVEKCVKLATPV
jgi:hypothetical protein